MTLAVVLFDAERRFAHELRSAWATGRRVVLSLVAGGRIEGHVESVAATGAFVKVRGAHVPMELVAAVHLPSRLGDSTARGSAFHGPGRRAPDPQVEQLWTGEP